MGCTPGLHTVGRVELQRPFGTWVWWAGPLCCEESRAGGSPGAGQLLILPRRLSKPPDTACVLRLGAGGGPWAGMFAEEVTVRALGDHGWGPGSHLPPTLSLSPWKPGWALQVAGVGCPTVNPVPALGGGGGGRLCGVCVPHAGPASQRTGLCHPRNAFDQELVQGGRKPAPGL